MSSQRVPQFEAEPPLAEVIELHGNRGVPETAEHDAAQPVPEEIVIAEHPLKLDEDEIKTLAVIAQNHEVGAIEAEDRYDGLSQEEFEAKVVSIADSLNHHNPPIRVVMKDQKAIAVVGLLAGEAFESGDGVLQRYGEHMLRKRAIHESGIKDLDTLHIVQPDTPDHANESGYQRSFYEEWAREHRTEEAEQQRKAAEWRIGRVTAEQRVAMTLLARGEELPESEHGVETQAATDIGSKVLEAASVALERAQPKLTKVADRFRNPGKDGTVVPIDTVAAVDTAIEAITKKYGPDHVLVKEEPIIPGDPRNLHVQQAKFEQDPNYEFEVEGKDAKTILEALTPLAEAITDEHELTTDEYTTALIASQVVTKAEKQTAAAKKDKPHHKRSRLNPLHS